MRTVVAEGVKGFDFVSRVSSSEPWISESTLINRENNNRQPTASTRGLAAHPDQ